MTTLTSASRQLFSRPPDEMFATLSDLHRHCLAIRDKSACLKEKATEFQPVVSNGTVAVQCNGYAPCRLNDWSLTQLCGLAAAAKETINRLQPTTAAIALTELLHQRTGNQTDLQALVYDSQVIRALNGERYSRLWNADVVSMLREFATDFTPPQKGFNGATGVYAGEQDMFCFLIDPTGWVEIEGEAFAPGFFVWNSEVGRRTVGISTFWFQAVCANHIVWDVIEFKEFTRRHTGNVAQSLSEIRNLVEALTKLRDRRKDGFAKVIRKAMETAYGRTSEEVVQLLAKAGFNAALAKRATQIAREKGKFSLWSVVDALTQLARETSFAGSRTTADEQASKLLALSIQ